MFQDKVVAAEKKLQKMIIQAGYDLPCKDHIAGVYYDSEDEDEDEKYENPPITSGSGKSSSPIKQKCLKTIPPIFAGPFLIVSSLLHWDLIK